MGKPSTEVRYHESGASLGQLHLGSDMLGKDEGIGFLKVIDIHAV